MAGRALVDVPMVLRIGILEILRDVVNLPNYGESKVGEGVGLEADDALSHTAEKQEFLFVSLRPRSYCSVKGVVNVKWLEGDERVTMRRIGCPRWVGAGKDVRWKRKW